MFRLILVAPIQTALVPLIDAIGGAETTTLAVPDAFAEQ
jgi:hypothetical protein